MKIGNWNIERLKNIKLKVEILEEINKQNFDVLVLTEYNESIKPLGFNYFVLTNSLMHVNTDNYKKTERRVAIFSKYPILNRFQTFNKYTACCVELATDYGNLVVYGTIIGVYGNRNQNFKDDLQKQIIDIKEISTKKSICVVGDYNMSFSDNYYYTKSGRETIIDSFQEFKIKNLTSDLKKNIDHISISENFINEFEINVETWNSDKKLSDHIGVLVEL